MKKLCYIIGACGAEEPVIPCRADALVIAADGGLRTLERCAITADLVVGDFDSLGRIPQGENVRRHPVEKDDTDTMLAVKLGLEQGCEVFILYGCTGGRPDHMYANLQTLRYLAGHGARGYLVGDGWISTVICSGEIVFPKGLFATVSVFCPDGVAEGVTLEGLQYSLQNGTLQSDFPLGVSNHIAGDAGRVAVKNGSLLVMWEESAAVFSKRI